jgi:hypothetical protein
MRQPEHYKHVFELQKLRITLALDNLLARPTISAAGRTIESIGGAEGDRTPDLMTASLKRVVSLRFPPCCLVLIC